MKKLLLISMALLLLVSCGDYQNQDDRVTSNDMTILDEKDDSFETKKILALGDSLTAGYGVQESENYPSKLESLLEENSYNYEIINAGVSGDTSQNLLDRAQLYIEQDPDIVLLIIGGNDGLQGKSVDEMKENIIKIIDLYDDGERKLVLGGMQVPINLGLQYSRDFNAIYKEISKERRDLYFLEEFLEGVAGYTKYNISDRIHPNPAGYDIVVGNLYDFLEDEDIITK